MHYHAIPCNTKQYHEMPCNTMQYHAIPCITNNCWRSVPLPCGQYNAIFYTSSPSFFPLGNFSKHLTILAPIVISLGNAPIFFSQCCSLLCSCLFFTTLHPKVILVCRAARPYCPRARSGNIAQMSIFGIAASPLESSGKTSNSKLFCLFNKGQRRKICNRKLVFNWSKKIIALLCIVVQIK